jgi:hypothetical protein
MTAERIYRFKIAMKYRRGLWRIIEMKGSQTLGDLDNAIRDAFKYDTGDHLSEFFRGKVWRSEGYGEISPGGGGPGGRRRADSLDLMEGQQIEYVYDFGDDVQSVITLEKITEQRDGEETQTRYPRVVAQNRPRRKYCSVCKKTGKESLATDVCEDCSNKRLIPFFLCEDCATKHSEEHHLYELVY